MFHVEHTPVQISASTARAFLQKLVNFGIDDLRRKLFRQVSDASRGRATHVPLGTFAASSHAQRHRPHGSHGFAGQQE